MADQITTAAQGSGEAAFPSEEVGDGSDGRGAPGQRKRREAERAATPLALVGLWVAYAWARLATLSVLLTTIWSRDHFQAHGLRRLQHRFWA